MKKNLFKPEQIAAILKQQELGTPVAEIVRKFGIAEQTFYRWKKQYGGLSSNQVIELKQLQEENGKLEAIGRGLKSGQDHAAGCPVAKMGRLSQRKQSSGTLAKHLSDQPATGVRGDDSASFDATLPQLQANPRGLAIPH